MIVLVWGNACPASCALLTRALNSLLQSGSEHEDSDYDAEEGEDTFEHPDLDEHDSDFEGADSGKAGAPAGDGDDDAHADTAAGGAGGGSAGASSKGGRRRASVAAFMSRVTRKKSKRPEAKSDASEMSLAGIYDGPAGGGEALCRKELETREGMLKKPSKSFFGGGWQSRMVKLEGRTISYTAKVSETTPRDSVVLTPTSEVAAVADGKHPYTFEVKTPHVQWKFQASSDTERDAWIDAIQERIDRDRTRDVAAELESQHVPKLGRARQLTDLVIDRMHGEGGDWKKKLPHCQVCGVKFGLQKRGTTFKRMRCKHCGRSCCLRCCADDSKRTLPKFGFNKAVRCCLDCTELLDHMEITVEQIEKAFDEGDFASVINLVSQGLVTPDYESKSHATPLILAVEMRSAISIETALEVGADIDWITTLPGSALISAVEMASGGDISIVELLLAKGADPMAQTPDGKSAFITACSSRDTACLDLFLAQDGVNVDEAHGSTLASPLMLISEAGLAISFDKLVSKGANPGANDAQGNTPLHYAARGGKATIVERLCAIESVNVNAVNAAGETALVVAASAGQAETTSLLLSNGADAMVRTAYGKDARRVAEDALVSLHDAIADLERDAAAAEDVATQDRIDDLRARVTALEAVTEVLSRMDTAIADGDFATVFSLISAKNYGIDYQTRDGITALMSASGGGDLAAMDELITRGASVDRASSTDGVPALFHAVRAGQYEAAKKLIDAGASVDVQDGEGRTVLIASAGAGSAGTVRLLLAARIDADVKDRQHQSALHAAAAGGHTAVMSSLIGHGVSVDVGDEGGRTPLALAAAAGHANAVELLAAAGADVNLQAGDDTTPLMAAAVNGQVETVELLMRLGANAMAVDAVQESTAAQMVERKIAHLEEEAAAAEEPDDDHERMSELAEERETEIATLARVAAALDTVGVALNSEPPNFEAVLGAITRGNYPPDYETTEGVTPLIRAAVAGDAAVILELVRLGADPNLPSRTTMLLPLQAAVMNNNVDAVTALCRAGAWVDMPLSSRGAAGKPVVVFACQPPELGEGATAALVQSAKDARAAALAVLLAHGADANYKNSTGESLLQLAAFAGQVEVVRVLLSEHADVFGEDNEGVFTLLRAAYGPKETVVEIMTMLLDAGADVNQLSSTDAASVVMAAAERGPPDLMQLLIERGADLLWERDDGETARQIAEARVTEARDAQNDGGGAAGVANSGGEPSTEGGEDADVTHSGSDDAGDTEEALSEDLKEAETVLKLILGLDHAIEAGDFDTVVSYVRRGNVTADYETDNGLTALAACAAAGDAAAVSELISLGANVSHRSSISGRTALQAAAAADKGDVAAALVAAGADGLVTDEEFGTFLLRAAARGWVAPLSGIVGNPSGFVIVDTAREDGTTPLMAAAQAGQAEAVKILLAAGAKAHARRGDGQRAIGLAEAGETPGHAECAELLGVMNAAIRDADAAAGIALVDSGSWTVDYADPGGKTLLMALAEKGDTAGVVELLDRRAGVNLINRREVVDEDDGDEEDAPDDGDLHGFTALMYACRAGASATALRLLRAGADVDVTDDSGKSALYYAAASGMTDVVKALLRADAPIPTKMRCSPLAAVVAAPKNRVDVAKAVLREGLQSEVFHANAVLQTLDDFARAHDGDAEDVVAFCETIPRAIAASSFETVVEASRGPLAALFPIDGVDASGHTALSKACEEGNTAAVLQLIDAGARVNRRARPPPRNRSESATSAASGANGAAAGGDGGADSTTARATFAELHYTPLMIAAAHNRGDTIRALLRERAKVRPQDLNGYDAMGIALRAGNADAVSALADHGVPVHTARFPSSEAVANAAAAEAKAREAARRATAASDAERVAAEAATRSGAAAAAAAAAAADAPDGASAGGDDADDKDGDAVDEGSSSDEEAAEIAVTGVELALLNGQVDTAKVLLDRGARLWPMSPGVEATLLAEGSAAVKALLSDLAYAPVSSPELLNVLDGLRVALDITPNDDWDSDARQRADVTALVSAMRSLEAAVDYAAVDAAKAREEEIQAAVTEASRETVFRAFLKHETPDGYGGLDEAGLTAALGELGVSGDGTDFASLSTPSPAGGDARVRFHELFTRAGARPRSLFSDEYRRASVQWLGAGAATDRHNGRHAWLTRLSTASTLQHVVGCIDRLGRALFVVAPRISGEEREGEDRGAARDADEAQYVAWLAGLETAAETAAKSVSEVNAQRAQRVSAGVRAARSQRVADALARVAARNAFSLKQSVAEVYEQSEKFKEGSEALDEWNRRELSKQWFGVMDDLAASSETKRAEHATTVRQNLGAAVDKSLSEARSREQDRLKRIRENNGALRPLAASKQFALLRAADAAGAADANAAASAGDSAALNGLNAGAGAGEAAVNRRISVRWTKSGSYVWYSGTVIQYLPDEDAHEVLYDDGSAAIYDLAQRTHRLGRDTRGGLAAGGGGSANAALSTRCGGDGGSDWGGEETTLSDTDDVSPESDGSGTDEADAAEDGTSIASEGGDVAGDDSAAGDEEGDQAGGASGVSDAAAPTQADAAPGEAAAEGATSAEGGAGGATDAAAAEAKPKVSSTIAGKLGSAFKKAEAQPTATDAVDDF